MRISTIIYIVSISVFHVLPFKKQICFLIKKTGIPFSKFYTDLRFRGNFRVNLAGKSFLLMNYMYTTIENEIFWKGIEKGWEKVSIDLWAKLSKKAEVVFDIGANTGIYSLVAKTMNQNLIVYSFEPSKRVFDKLKDNIEINSYDIQANQVAISNVDKELVFYDTYGKHQYSASLSLEMKNNLTSAGVQIHEYTVKAQTIKSFIKDKNIMKLDLVKIDVELHEYEVLDGFGELIDIYKPTFLIEVLTDDLALRIEPFFLKSKYLFFSIDEEQKATCVKHLSKSSGYNYLICSLEDANYLGLQI